MSGLILPLIIIGRVASRWISATPAARRTLSPVAFASVVLLLGIVLTQVPRVLNATMEVQLLFRYIQFIARATLPLAFLYALLPWPARTRAALSFSPPYLNLV